MAFKLHVRVVEATDIAKMDANASDPYCILRTSSETMKTRVIKNNMHPRWNQEFHFSIGSPTVGALDIKMRDKDIMKDDDMSTLNIQLCSLPIGQVIDQWYDMIPCKRVKKGGRIHLVLQVAPNGAPPFVPQAAPQPGFYPGAPVGYGPYPGAPVGYPPQGFPPQGYPPQGMPPQGYPPQGYPPQGFPQQGMPPQGYPPQGYPPQGFPPQGMPPQGYPPQGYPPQYPPGRM